MHKPKLNLKSILLGFSLALLLTIPALWYVYAVSSSKITFVTGGIFPGAPEFTLWNEGTDYFMKSSSGEVTGSTNSSDIIAQAIAGLTAGRNWKERILIKGFWTIDLLVDTALRTGIKLGSYTILEIDGTIKLANGANTVAGINNFMIRVPDNSMCVEIKGGEIDGNKEYQGSPATNFVYGIEIGNSTEIQISNVWVHHTTETGIAIEGASHLCWVTNCYVNATNEDGIGNQYTASDVFYTNNHVEGCRTPGSGIFVEGGDHIVVDSNTCYNNTNGIKITRGTATASMRVSVQNNHCYNNTYSGINLGEYVTNCVVDGNECYYNSGDGITLDDYSHRNCVSNNIVFSNDISQTNHCGIFLDSFINFTVLVGNLCFDNQTVVTQNWGIYETGLQSNANLYSADYCLGNQYGGIWISVTIPTLFNGRITGCLNGTGPGTGTNPSGWITVWGSAAFTG